LLGQIQAFRSGRKWIWIALAIPTLVCMFAFYNAGSATNPPGFYQDESADAYNAYTILHSGVDEHGVSWPLYFESFGGDADYKSAPLIYALAGWFAVAGASISSARTLTALLGFSAALLLALLAFRLSRRVSVAAIVLVTSLLMPWLFEDSRLVFEEALFPLALAAFLFAVHRASERISWSWLDAGTVSSTLALITYTYAAGRVLGPLLAVGLLAFGGRGRWGNVTKSWTLYGLILVPMAVFALQHPGALTSRIGAVGYLSSATPFDIAARFLQQYLGNFSLVSWLLVGDPNQRQHIAGVTGEMLVGTFVLMIVGIDLVVHGHQPQRYWRFILYGLAAAAVPAALTTDAFHSLRLVGVPVFATVLTVPALEWLTRHAVGSRAASSALAAITALTLIQGLWFRAEYAAQGPFRGDWLDAGFPALLSQALESSPRRVYVVGGAEQTYIQAYWYGVLRGIPASFFVRTTPGGPPAGAIVISSAPNCDACAVIARSGFYSLYRVR
jgi:hypothetical protein